MRAEERPADRPPLTESDPGEPLDALADAPMSPFQWRAVAIVGTLYMIDGFDVSALSFAAPALLREWGMGKIELGAALSAGLLGMALGSLCLSPAADRWGRRPVLLPSLAVITCGALWTATCHAIGSLSASRFLTGLGIGAMLGVIAPLAAEYSNRRHRDGNVSLTALCFAVGSILGGGVSAWLLHGHGWRTIFIAAAVLGCVVTVLAWLWLVEPPTGLLARPVVGRLDKVNAYLLRCGRSPLTDLPPAPRRARPPVLDLFAPAMARRTLTTILLYFAYVIPFYFMQVWLPTITVQDGMTASEGALLSAMLSFGGVVGGVVIASTSRRIGLKRIQLIFLIGSVATMAAFAFAPSDFAALLAAAGATGLFLLGSQVGFWAILVHVFPTPQRASGVGLVIGAGRLGSAIPSLLAGLLFAAGLNARAVVLIMLLPLLVTIGLLAILPVWEDQTQT